MDSEKIILIVLGVLLVTVMVFRKSPPQVINTAENVVDAGKTGGPAYTQYNQPGYAADIGLGFVMPQRAVMPSGEKPVRQEKYNFCGC